MLQDQMPGPPMINYSLKNPAGHSSRRAKSQVKNHGLEIMKSGLECNRFERFSFYAG
jgi:hypothetical protein